MKITPEEIYQAYAKGVGGKTYDGKPLPDFYDLGSQRKGWIAVEKFIRSKDNDRC